MGYMEQEGPDFEKAIADFSAALEIQPSLHLAYRMRGMARLKIRDFEDALADLTEYVDSGGARQQGEHQEMLKLVDEVAKMRRPSGTP